RRELAAQDAAMIADTVDPMQYLPPELRDMPELAKLAATGASLSADAAWRETFIYARGSETVALRLTRTAAPSSLAGLALQAAEANMASARPSRAFALVAGVAFQEDLGAFGSGPAAGGWRGFSAGIGDELRLTVRAQAPDEAVLDLLQAIDFDALNSLLSAPVAGIGARAASVPAGQQAEEAEARLAADRTRR